MRTKGEGVCQKILNLSGYPIYMPPFPLIATAREMMGSSGSRLESPTHASSQESSATPQQSLSVPGKFGNSSETNLTRTDERTDERTNERTLPLVELPASPQLKILSTSQTCIGFGLTDERHECSHITLCY